MHLMGAACDVARLETPAAAMHVIRYLSLGEIQLGSSAWNYYLDVMLTMALICRRSRSVVVQY